MARRWRALPLPDKLRMTRANSSRPRLSAIRIVAEFALLVDCSSFVRHGLGTSSMERYIISVPCAEISTADVWNTPDSPSGRILPQWGHFVGTPTAANRLPHPLHVIRPPPLAF
jgi:hypothetical protein